MEANLSSSMELKDEAASSSSSSSPTSIITIITTTEEKDNSSSSSSSTTTSSSSSTTAEEKDKEGVFRGCKCPVKRDIWSLLYKQGEDIVKREPILEPLIKKAILMHDSFGQALASRLAQKLGGKVIEENLLKGLFLECIQLSLDNQCDDVERLAIIDMVAVEERDPACRSVLSVFLYFKGYMAIQCYRMAHVLWTRGRLDMALMLQSKAAEIFGVDIHPGAKIACGLMIDHGTGVVIGETTHIGSNCTFLHGVTLGGTGKSTTFDRHPKLGNNVFLGCQATILGPIKIGNHVTVGAGSLVLKSLPDGATAVGSPAVIKGIDARYQTNETAVSENKEIIDVPILPSLPSTPDLGNTELKAKKGLQLELWQSTWMPKVWSTVDGWIEGWNKTTHRTWEDYVIEGYLDE